MTPDPPTIVGFTVEDRAILSAVHHEARILLPLVRWSFIAWAALAGVNLYATGAP